jgi:DNA (cytosine-5)-methyltransferase 1
MPIRVVELFAGVGGFRIGFEKPSLNDKFKVIWSNQWEPSTKKQLATEVYTARWNMTPLSTDPEVYIGDSDETDIHVNKDIHSIKADEIPDFDLLCGGFPCQDYSVAKTANKAVGIQGKKGVLWWDIRRIVEAKQPRIAVLENVDRLLKSPTSQRGRDFAVMLASLDELGYVVEWRSINAAEYGMPQRRRRVFIIAYSKESKHYSKLKESIPIDYLSKNGNLAKAFPIQRPMILSCPSIILRKKKTSDLSDVSLDFNKDAKKTSTSPFKKCGMMRDGIAYTFDGIPDYKGPFATLGEVLLKPVKIPQEYYVSPEDILKPKGWKYLKGAKKEQREGTEGFTYSYNEGAMKFPDPTDKASRTIITGEGGSTPSRFKHAIVFRPPKSKLESLKLDSKKHEMVRKNFNMKKNEWIRRLTPIELERLNMFPDNHTIGPSDGKRAFFMGNALVVGIIERLAKILMLDSELENSIIKPKSPHRFVPVGGNIN